MVTTFQLYFRHFIISLLHISALKYKVRYVERIFKVTRVH